MAIRRTTSSSSSSSSSIIFSAIVVALITVKSCSSSSSSDDCNASLLIKLSECLKYVEKGSTLTEPNKDCCSKLEDLVASNPICLCQLTTGGNRSSSSSGGLNIDTERAQNLPKLCSVSIPSLNLCLGANGPARNNGNKEVISSTLSSKLAFFVTFLFTFF